MALAAGGFLVIAAAAGTAAYLTMGHTALPPLKVTGHLVLRAGYPAAFNADQGQPCNGVGGYDDVIAGASVVVRDSGGKTVGTAALEPGMPGDFHDTGFGLVPDTCDFAFQVAGVPPSSKFYSIEVTHRGQVTYTKQQLVTGPTLTLGG